MTLFINYLPLQMTQVDLLALFEEYGAIKHIFFSTDWKTGKALGFAFVEMSVKAQENSAKFDLNGSSWMGNQLQINEISSNEESVKRFEQRCQRNQN